MSENGGPKVLILGDSFIFGQGVPRSDRFDQVMSDQGYPKPIINLGVSGYSTDQEFLVAAPYLDDLTNGDTVVLLTFGDDFKGLISDYFAGRPKPRYLSGSGTLTLVPPRIRLVDILRDRSYVFRAAHRWLTRRETPPKKLSFKDLDEAEDVYHQLLLRHLVPVSQRGVKVVLAFHGRAIVDKDFEASAGQRVEYNIRRISQQYAFTYLDLDPELDHDRYRQPDGLHWAPAGHQKFANILLGACGGSEYRIHLHEEEAI